MTMEFLKENLLNTTTQITVDSNTVTVEFLFDRNTALGYTTDGYNSTTSTLINITFDDTQSISHIFLQNHNLKTFRVFYNSLTANSLFTTSTNSDTSTYISFSTVSAKTVHVQLDAATATDTEKTVGELVVTQRRLQFTRNPSQSNYKPIIDKKQIEHRMPDGGSILYNIKDKFKASISLKHITPAFFTSFKAIYQEALPIYFIPFPTSSGWDSEAHLTVWAGKFDFRFSDNAKTAYSGSINLKETFSG